MHSLFDYFTAAQRLAEAARATEERRLALLTAKIERDRLRIEAAEEKRARRRTRNQRIAGVR